MKKNYLSLLLMFFILLGLKQTPIRALDLNDEFQFVSLYYEKMDIKIDVTETGLIKINTTIDAQFNSRMHGIQVWIPQKYEMTFQDPETGFPTTKDYYWKVQNVQNKSDQPMDQSTIENSALRLRFGDPDRRISGPQRYEYYYEVQTYDLDYNDLEMFYWNIVGTGHEVDTKKVTFEVNLPKPVTHPLYIHTGSYYSTDNQYVDYTFTQNQFLKGESIDVIPRGVGITAQVDLEPGYFDYPERPNYTMIGLGLLGIGAVLTSYWFIKHGRDEDIIITIEHEPPSDLSSAMVGYIYNNRARSKDVISLIIEWASQGYIRIDELEGDNIQLTKLKDIETSRVAYEQKFFNDLFNNREVVTTDQLENKFYRNIGSAVTSLSNHFKTKNRRLFNMTSNTFKGISFILAALVMGTFIGITIYNKFFIFGYAMIGFIIATVVSLFFAIIQMYLFVDFTIQSRGKQILDIVLSLVLTAIFVGVYFVIMSFFEALNLYSFIAIALFFIIVIATINMGQRTEYARKQMGKILGLRRFIEEAEKERLEMLVHDDPKYFYSVLPYAYVLGVSDVWSKKFENIAIAPPEGYDGRTFSPIYYTNRLNNMAHRTEHSMTSTPAPKGSGSGGFGGGSFGGGGGGGGFSGGGFGGGGSGGW